MLKKVTSLLLVFSLFVSLGLSSYASAAQNDTYSKVDQECEECENKNNPLSEEAIKLMGGTVTKIEITDENFEIAMEMAESQLEELTTVKKNGELKVPFASASEANVSEKTFTTFKNIINLFNTKINDGELKAIDSENGFELQETNTIKINKNKIQPQFSVIGSNYFYFSNSDISKVNKIITAGGSLATLAAALATTGGTAAIIAGVFGVYAAAINLCNWNDKGAYVRKVSSSPSPVGTWVCWPGS